MYKRVLKVDASRLTTLYVFVDGDDSSGSEICSVRCKYNGLEGELEYETEQIYT